VKKFRRFLALVVLLAVSLMTLAIAEDKTEIAIDSARNTAIKFKSSERADGVNGTFEVKGDIVKGLIAAVADLKFDAETAKQMGDAQGNLFYNLANEMELVGNLDVPVPSDGNDLSKLQGNLESVMTESNAYAKGSFSVEGKSATEAPTVNVDFSAKSDSKAFDGKVNFDVTSGDMGEVPFKSLDFTISEPDDSTTLAIEIKVATSSPMAGQLKQMGQNPDQVKSGITQQLGRAGIQVESVELGEYKEEGGNASVKLSIKMKEWRNLVKSGVGMMGGGRFDVAKLSESVNKLLEAKFENINFKLDAEGKTLKGQLTGKVQNIRQFLLGYYELTALITEAQLKDQGDSDDPGKRFMLAYQAVAMEEAKKGVQAMLDSDMGFDLKGKVNVKSAGEDKKTVNASGDLDMSFSNFKAYIAKANEAGIPVGKNTAIKLQAGMSGQSRVTGTLYAYSDAAFVNYYKRLLLATARQAGASPEAMATAEKIEFKTSAGSLALNKEGLKGSNYLESSDLTPAAKAVLTAASNNKLQGDLTGFAVTGKGEGEKMNIDGAIYFAKFMEGKSAADIKSTLGMSDATVNEKAKPEEVVLVAVSKPEVAMPEALKPVAQDGKKLISSPMAAVSGALGGGKGGSGGLLALGGLAVLGLVGVGMMAGKKKS